MDTTDWTYDDFIAYLLVFASMEDYEVTKEEEEYLISRLGEENYRKMQSLIDRSTVAEQMDTVSSLSKRYCTDRESCRKVLDDVKDLFMSNNEFSALEQTILIGLEKLIGGKT